ncbi:hypothetical protein LNA02_02840 [Levilactobacillus namurensis]|nr:hypothetical protein LNA02_02840 [Levilactobacillus namurensis]
MYKFWLIRAGLPENGADVNWIAGNIEPVRIASIFQYRSIFKIHILMKVVLKRTSIPNPREPGIIIF